ncbi:MAG: thiolase family protein [Ignavibacteriae bacterium]|nr:thiolase family protein [Ignavibacteria bacterium]MBI3363606.1 thiolase family protein [Ignavibacteriota bacterium]
MVRTEAVILDAARTPIGRYGGAFRDVRPDDLSALIIKTLSERTALDPSVIQDVMWGCANQAGEDNRNIGRMSALLAGLPYSVPATTINRLCGSSLDAINHAARAIWSGDLEIVIAGGVESMSRAPYSLPKNQTGAYGNISAYDTALGWRYPNPKMEKLFPLETMGETAENIAEKYTISREEQDQFACNSHVKAVRAQTSGAFNDEIVPVEVPQRKGNPVIIKQDEGPRSDTSMEKLAALQPAFRKDGTVTAGNSSSLNDGAAAVLIMSEQRARDFGKRPMARIVATGLAGVDPRYMGIGPVPAVRQALQKAKLTMNQIDVVELNEAFAAQSLAVVRDLDLDPTKLNVNGGAIALGHPLGCSGARIMTTLLHEMKRRKARYGLATMCIGVGQGIATIVESTYL